ncbi:MAG TPA: SPFH/Band 7/PHB domain protein [Thiotrichales bacterium]|nr:SPFH/Band 7/PHB domain protein [Thiotrichales bacterium]
MTSIVSVFVIVLAIVIVATLWAGIKIVPQGEEWTVERFGKYRATLTPGLHIVVPYIDRIGSKVNMMESVLDIPSQEVITKDNAMVRADGVLYYQVVDAARAAYEVRDMIRAMENLAMTNIRTVIGSMDLDEILSGREKINTSLLGVVDAASNAWGIKITRVEIKDIAPPDDLVNAMAQQMKAEREKRAAILEAEGEREAAIKRAEGQKQAAILEAEGQKQAAFREAEARERLAEAESRATEVVSKAITEGDPRAIHYFVAQKYVEALTAIGNGENSRLVFLPMEASGIASSVGGITELLKDIGKSREAV